MKSKRLIRTANIPFRGFIPRVEMVPALFVADDADSSRRSDRKGETSYRTQRPLHREACLTTIHRARGRIPHFLKVCVRSGHDEGSSLPINFPSSVLVSERPITSNNGHPRAIYRVCAARMSPEKILGRLVTSESIPREPRHRSHELHARFVQSDIAVASCFRAERETCNVRGFK